MYILFGGETHYARGGANDIMMSGDNLTEIQRLAESYIGKEVLVSETEWDGPTYFTFEWTHIFDTIQNKVIARYGGIPYGEHK